MNTSLSNQINLREITPGNWREISKLQVHENQKEWVAEPTYYLCLCNYGKLWNPKAIYLEDTIVGFLMWAFDESDNSYWIGGITIDKNHQKKGYGRTAIIEIIEELKNTKNATCFALSFAPDNPASKLYKSIGFVENGEYEDDEIVARLKS
ncbi:GNAT family N-acetyltransferase [Oceanispirochaeta crateris]|uniref:GNAT family N-acetyltransferase n=1 Tax=Oceanispirochaeta crateris TaxID=2518645 RepID=A0A5C1QQV9_9SPIO|nr:GNAT family N-acetyltransferase [Oceanispirochaeta crateris]QEN09004.1 GNAT family N-acetyltransferase [Oceanispirochaeta crateris]